MARYGSLEEPDAKAEVETEAGCCVLQLEQPDSATTLDLISDEQHLALCVHRLQIRAIPPDDQPGPAFASCHFTSSSLPRNE